MDQIPGSLTEEEALEALEIIYKTLDGALALLRKIRDYHYGFMETAPGYFEEVDAFLKDLDGEK